MARYTVPPCRTVRWGPVRAQRRSRRAGGSDAAEEVAEVPLHSVMPHGIGRPVEARECRAPDGKGEACGAPCCVGSERRCCRGTGNAWGPVHERRRGQAGGQGRAIRGGRICCWVTMQLDLVALESRWDDEPQDESMRNGHGETGEATSWKEKGTIKRRKRMKSRKERWLERAEGCVGGGWRDLGEGIPRKAQWKEAARRPSRARARWCAVCCSSHIICRFKIL